MYVVLLILQIVPIIPVALVERVGARPEDGSSSRSFYVTCHANGSKHNTLFQYC